jgi:hypothetical protein
MCEHVRLKPDICDQALGVVCLDCNEFIACCWGDAHVSERLWNRACENDSDGIPCERSRGDICALCGESFTLVLQSEAHQ